MNLNASFTSKIILVVLSCLPALLHAQPGDPGGAPNGAPLDGGVSLMIAAGVAYASKKAYDKRKKNGD